MIGERATSGVADRRHLTRTLGKIFMKVTANQQRKGFRLPFLALIAIGMTTANVQSATYPDMPYTGPTPLTKVTAVFDLQSSFPS